MWYTAEVRRTSANSWGVCGNGTSGLGCGPQVSSTYSRLFTVLCSQETFRNCADVRIVSSPSQLPATDNPRAIMIRDLRGGLTPLVVRSQVGKELNKPKHPDC